MYCSAALWQWSQVQSLYSAIGNLSAAFNTQTVDKVRLCSATWSEFSVEFEKWWSEDSRATSQVRNMQPWQQDREKGEIRLERNWGKEIKIVTGEDLSEVGDWPQARQSGISDQWPAG